MSESHRDEVAQAEADAEDAVALRDEAARLQSQLSAAQAQLEEEKKLRAASDLATMKARDVAAVAEAKLAEAEVKVEAAAKQAVKQAAAVDAAAARETVARAAAERAAAERAAAFAPANAPATSDAEPPYFEASDYFEEDEDGEVERARLAARGGGGEPPEERYGGAELSRMTEQRLRIEDLQEELFEREHESCLLYTSPSPRDS